MELYDVHLSKFPLYAFKLAEDAASLRIANITDKLMFVLTKGPFHFVLLNASPRRSSVYFCAEQDTYVLSVVSRLLASVGNSPNNTRQFAAAVMQQFEFPADQKPSGYFRGFGEHYYPSAKPTFALEFKY